MPAPRLSRRDVLAATTGAIALGSSLVSDNASAAESVPADYKIQNGRIRQSVMGWCFNPMPPVELAQHCRDIGLVAIEGIGAEHYPAVRKLGLKISLVSSHGFAKGP